MDKINLGRKKVVFDRQRGYMTFVISLTNTAMLVGLTVATWGWHWWYLLLLPLFVIGFDLYRRFVFYDKKTILKQEQEFLHRNSPVFTEMNQKLDEILKKLNEDSLDRK